MSQRVITVKDLGKRYRIGQRERYLALRDVLANSLKAPWRMFRPAGNLTGRQPQHIWALKDVCFEIGEGEVVGIIGRNGAGKTTLLKILSRITKPTAGWAEVCGRVGSVLEVGTGFHPELTGRENVYLNGAILGMKKREIADKFDQIVAFSGVGDFIETPLKHYSSGMQARLAFAVASHLEPEILLVDEVLAVGDLEFQKKCLDKMRGMARGGQTVLLVSHQMGAITRLCRKGIWLEQGRIQMAGLAEDVVNAYMGNRPGAEGERRWESPHEAPGDEKIRLRAVRVIDAAGKIRGSVNIRREFSIEIEYVILKRLANMRTVLRLLAGDGTVVFTSSDTLDSAWEGVARSPGTYVSRCTVPGNFLNEGRYTLTVSADIPFTELWIAQHVVDFFVDQTGGVGPRYGERWPGVVCPALEWHVEQLEEFAARDE